LLHVACRIVKVVILVIRRLAEHPESSKGWILAPVPFDTGLEQARMTNRTIKS